MWLGINDEVIGPSKTIAGLINTASRQSRTTCMSGAKKAWMFSDYSGEDKKSSFEVYTFLLFDLARSEEFVKSLDSLRKHTLRDSRRISYKRLSEPLIHKASLELILNAKRFLSGNSITIAVERKVKTLLTKDNDTNKSLRHADNYFSEISKSSVFERHARIIHFAMMTACGFCPDGCDLMWITDRDEVIANDRRLEGFRSHAVNIGSQYARASMGTMSIHSSACDDGSRNLFDCLAVADLLAGSFQEVMTMRAAAGLSSGRIWTPLTATKSARANKIISSLYKTSGVFSHLFFSIRKSDVDDEDSVMISEIGFFDEAIPGEAIWVPR